MIKGSRIYQYILLNWKTEETRDELRTIYQMGLSNFIQGNLLKNQ